MAESSQQGRSGQTMIFQTLIVFFSSCLVTVSNIENGHTAVRHSYPWLLNLHVFNGSDMRRCGANLIRVPYLEGASDIAISAAHCVNESHGVPVSDLRHWTYVIASDHDTEESDVGETKACVARSVPHEKFSLGRYQYDIAVLKLNRSIKFSETIQPIQLPSDGEEVPAGADCRIGGWGLLGYENLSNGSVIPKIARYLQESAAVMTPLPCCEILNSVYARLSDVHLERAIKHFEKRCQYVSGRFVEYANPDLILYSIDLVSSGKLQSGDSGSGLVCRKNGDGVPILYGIASAHLLLQNSNDQCGYYTKVGAFTDWIREQIDQLRQGELAREKELQPPLSSWDIFCLFVTALCTFEVL